jgi:hypothetical protein
MRQKLSFYVFMPNESWPSSSGLRGRRRTYYTILKLADYALSKTVRYVLLLPLRPELDGQDTFGMNTKKDNFCLMTPIVKCKAV